MGSPFFPLMRPRPRPPGRLPVPPVALEPPPPIGEEDEGFLPQIRLGIGNRAPQAVSQAGLPPGKDNPAEVQAPSQYAGPTQEVSTIPLVTPREESADEIPAELPMRSYRTPNETSLGDWAKEVQRREGPPKLSANKSVRTYTNKDLDEVVRENRGSVMQVHSSSTTDQDEFDLDRREAREDTEYRAGQARLNAILNDPDGSKAREGQYQRQLGIAQAGGEGRLRQSDYDADIRQLNRDRVSGLANIDARLAAGKITAPQAAAEQQSLKIAFAEALSELSDVAYQRRTRTRSEELALEEAPPVFEDNN